MASVLRENLEDVSVSIRDLPAERIGWASTECVLKAEKPDLLCLGEETVSCHEAIRMANLAKKMFPGITVICGGTHFSNTIEETLHNPVFDFVVQQEGEATLNELVKCLLEKKDYSKVFGIAYKNGKKIVITPNRPLLDMDLLPFPAYDLLNMDNYGKRSKTHKDLVAVEHSRGCSFQCNFCVLWKHMGKKRGNTFIPCYRTKSAKKTADEVQLIKEKFHRKTFCWVDPTWNLDSKWNKEFVKELIDRDIDVDHSAWMRADCIVRDYNNGTLKQQVKAGLKQAMIGVERSEQKDLEFLGKGIQNFEIAKKAFECLGKYPQVLKIATYIYGLPYESVSTLDHFYSDLEKINFDISLPIPLTPAPGTLFYEKYKDYVEIKDFSFYNFLNPIMRTDHLSRSKLVYESNKRELFLRVSHFPSNSLGSSRSKTAVRRITKAKMFTTLRFVKNILTETVLQRPTNLNIKPSWYNS